MKTVNTRRGSRLVQAIPATESIWSIYHGDRPDWLTVGKDQNGKWWASVWGADEQEVKKRLRELGRRERSSCGTRGRDRSGRCPKCGEDEWDGLFCDFCGWDGND
jgi:hypothetical protein